MPQPKLTAGLASPSRIRSGFKFGKHTTVFKQ